MNRVVPTIKNGSKQLLFSETICIDPNEGLQLVIPVTPEKTIEFRLVFRNAESETGKVSPYVDSTGVTLTLTNFLSALGTSLSQPFKFAIGPSNFSFMIYGESNSPSLIRLTVSLFTSESK